MNDIFNNTIHRYGYASVAGSIEGASPHRLIQLLMDGFLTRISAASIALQYGNMESMGRNVTKAIAIVEGLRDCLDMNVGGALAQDLYDIYQYIIDCLVETTQDNRAEKFVETTHLMRELKAGWDSIPMELRGGVPRPEQYAASGEVGLLNGRC